MENKEKTTHNVVQTIETKSLPCYESNDLLTILFPTTETVFVDMPMPIREGLITTVLPEAKYSILNELFALAREREGLDRLNKGN